MIFSCHCFVVLTSVDCVSCPQSVLDVTGSLNLTSVEDALDQANTSLVQWNTDHGTNAAVAQLRSDLVVSLR